jgi:hypothetical protein
MLELAVRHAVASLFYYEYGIKLSRTASNQWYGNEKIPQLRATFFVNDEQTCAQLKKDIEGGADFRGRRARAFDVPVGAPRRRPRRVLARRDGTGVRHRRVSARR